jgi:hypothetical protein
LIEKLKNEAHLVDEGKIVWLNLFNINWDLALAVEIILAAQL